MLKEHELILEDISAALARTRSLYARGCKLDDVKAQLEEAAAAVRRRIASYGPRSEPIVGRGPSPGVVAFSAAAAPAAAPRSGTSAPSAVPDRLSSQPKPPAQGQKPKPSVS